MGDLEQASFMRPSDIPTLDQLNTALRNQKLRRYNGIISQVFVDGVDIGTDQPRDAAEKITYRFALVGESAQIDQPNPIVPSNRKLARTRIIGSSVLDPVEVLIYDGKVRVNIHEEVDPYGCSQLPVED